MNPIAKLNHLVRRLHEDENGDIPVGGLMITGLIVIPLVIMLVTFRQELTTWLKARWDALVAEPVDQPFGSSDNNG